MGEAKRRQKVLENGPCLCGSTRAAIQCCFKGKIWRKSFAKLGLRTLRPALTVDRCYMKGLGSCDGGISGEHLITESVIEVLQAGGDFSVSGLPWLPEGETKVIGKSGLKGKCLCEKHNSSLHPLDDAAKAFFSNLKTCLDRDGSDRRHIVSGHDIERWLLKTTAAMAFSGNFGKGKVKCFTRFAPGIDVIGLLDDPASWPETAGLYCTMVPGELTANHNRFQCSPLSNEYDEILGLIADIMGVRFNLLFKPRAEIGIDLSKALYRPTGIEITYPGSKDIILISWEDGGRGRNRFALLFMSRSPGSL